jgi:hypothetical protein
MIYIMTAGDYLGLLSIRGLMRYAVPLMLWTNHFQVEYQLDHSSLFEV